LTPWNYSSYATTTLLIAVLIQVCQDEFDDYNKLIVGYMISRILVMAIINSCSEWQSKFYMSIKLREFPNLISLLISSYGNKIFCNSNEFVLYNDEFIRNKILMTGSDSLMCIFLLFLQKNEQQWLICCCWMSQVIYNVVFIKQWTKFSGKINSSHFSTIENNNDFPLSNKLVKASYQSAQSWIKIISIMILIITPIRSTHILKSSFEYGICYMIYHYMFSSFTFIIINRLIGVYVCFPGSFNIIARILEFQYPKLEYLKQSSFNVGGLVITFGVILLINIFHLSLSNQAVSVSVLISLVSLTVLLASYYNLVSLRKKLNDIYRSDNLFDRRSMFP